MIDEIRNLSPELKAVFKQKIAGAIYIELKTSGYPVTFGDLKTSIGCASNSLSNNLKRGQQIGVWKKTVKGYKLTAKGENLPHCVAAHTKLQMGELEEYKNNKYLHIDQEQGESKVLTDNSDDSVCVSTTFGEVRDSPTTQTESDSNWIGCITTEASDDN